MWHEQVALIWISPLQLAGSIVTYELVLIQFQEDEKAWDMECKH